MNRQNELGNTTYTQAGPELPVEKLLCISTQDVIPDTTKQKLEQLYDRLDRLSLDNKKKLFVCKYLGGNPWANSKIE